jgi:hypothetical protein
MSIASPLLSIHVDSLTVCAIRSKLLASIRDASYSCTKLHRLSKCVETFVALRGPGDHPLKAGRAMLDPIVVLKADCPEIQ